MITEPNMAGRTTRQGSRSQTPNSARGMMGHLGLKSSALAPTDSKLTSQYMVLDHMNAHYKKLSKAKACVDTAPPKAWLVSQKARDRTRRDALKDEYKRRADWLMTNRSTSRDSERDRNEMIAMMESFSGLDDSYDEADGPNDHPSETTSKVNRLNPDDINFVNHMVSDQTQSPSKYHSSKVMKSNIPATNARPRSKANLSKTHGTVTGHVTPRQQARPPRKSDLIEKQSHLFTQEKPFTPRTLKSKPEVQSRLSTFKYYNAPKKSAKEPTAPPRPASSMKGSVRAGSFISRPETPYSDSVDLMNETLMSRDMNHKHTPSGVPPLDISLDADNMKWMKENMQKGWLNEQNKKAQIRAQSRTRSDAGSDLGSTRPRHPTPTRTLNASHTLTKGDKENTEEELKYLEFLTEVTNDVLDRGIFTNRVLKQVFNNHLDRHKRDLKQDRMYEMLENLRQDLGIPDDHTDDGLGMNSTRGYSPDGLDSTAGLDDTTSSLPPGVAPRPRRRSNGLEPSSKPNLPRLRLGGEGKPPLPRPGSRGSRSRPGSAASNLANLHDVQEETEDSSITFTQSEEPSSGKADILKITHDDEEPLSFRPIEEEMVHEDHAMMRHNDMNGLDDTLTEQYMQHVDNMDDSTLARSEDYQAHSEDYQAHSEDYQAHSEDYQAHSEEYQAHSEEYPAHSEEYHAHSEEYHPHHDDLHDDAKTEQELQDLVTERDEDDLTPQPTEQPNLELDITESADPEYSDYGGYEDSFEPEMETPKKKKVPTATLR